MNMHLREMKSSVHRMFADTCPHSSFLYPSTHFFFLSFFFFLFSLWEFVNFDSLVPSLLPMKSVVDVIRIPPHSN